MMPRQPWIAAFIGHVLRRGLDDDPDLAFDAADELFPTLRELNPEFAADSAFGADGAKPRRGPAPASRRPLLAGVRRA